MLKPNALPARLQNVFTLSEPKALLIDMDGTVVDSLPLLFDAYRTFLHQFGQTGTSEEFLALIGPSLPEIVAILKNRYNLKGEQDLLLESYQKGLLHIYRHQVRAFPFVREVLSYAKKRGFKLALVSSAESRIVEACLAGLSLTSFFDAVVTKQMHLRSKPEPDLYLAALDQLKVDASRALAIEDAKNGVAASTAAHIFTLWLAHSHPLAPTKPDDLYMYVNDWAAILALLKGEMCV